MKTHKDIQAELGREVPELHVTIAKHLAHGIPEADIAEVLGEHPDTIRSLVCHEEFTELRRLVAGDIMGAELSRDISWDSLEDKALEGLHSSIKTTRDPELLLKVAGMANKAVRRQKQSRSAIDTAGMARVSITLQSRFVQVLQSDAQQVNGRDIRRMSAVTPGQALETLAPEQLQRTPRVGNREDEKSGADAFLDVLMARAAE